MASYDLIVIGGGINGAGIARDAAMRGLSVCLLEADDWGSGTSSKSSMLAHGGLRYLEQFELGLVHEALQDREIMFRQAPHLVRPLQFVYPIYPHVASRRTVRAGLLLYDILSYGKSVPSREYLRRDKLLERLPGLNPDELKGGATYYDGQFLSVERFVWELVLEARRHGAECRNHTAVTGLILDGGQCRGVRLPDGTEIRGAAIINAAGPWVDQFLDQAVGPEHQLIRKTKGIHIAVKGFIDTALIVRATDGRTFFFIPWQGYTLIGTTDTDYTDDPKDATATAADVEYLLAGARQYFPDADLNILFTYAGVRPLRHEAGLTESHVSRKHALHDHAGDGIGGLWSVQGGKLTTYRHLSEQAVTKVAKFIGKPHKARPTRTGTLPGGPLIEWDNFRAQAVLVATQQYKLPPATAEHLIDTYGAQWQSVVDQGDLTRISKGRPHIWAEVEFAVRSEDARTVADVMLRRTNLGFAPTGAAGTAKAISKRMARLLDWTDKQMNEALADYLAEVEKFAIPKI